MHYPARNDWFVLPDRQWGQSPGEDFPVELSTRHLCNGLETLFRHFTVVPFTAHFKNRGRHSRTTGAMRGMSSPQLRWDHFTTRAIPKAQCHALRWGVPQSVQTRNVARERCHDRLYPNSVEFTENETK